MSGSTSKLTLQELFSYPKFKCRPFLLQNLDENEKTELLAMAEYLMEKIFHNNNKLLIFACL